MPPNVYGVDEKKIKKDVIVPPEGGKVIRKNFEYMPGITWLEAVMYGAPQTGSDWNILDAAPYFLPKNSVRMRTSLILVNFGRRLRNEAEALEWAEPFTIGPANPRKVFALGQRYDRLDRLLDCSPLAISPLSTFPFRELPRTPCLTWNEEGHRMGLLSDPESPCEPWFWFAFENVR